MPANPLGIDHTRDGSGTSWMPDATPMQGAMRAAGPWTLMVHGSAFVQFVDTTGARGDDQLGSVNWIMGMAQRPVAGGQLLIRGMLSLEPLTVGKCGYPDLLQSGEFCNGSALHDQQHPHDLFIELAADYRRAITSSVAFEVYGGPSGEPALGPTAFPHRLSASASPIAPISHHWLDSSHVSFGVITGGVYGRRWKAETSVFNGREPDDNRYDFDFGSLTSYSGRLWILPTPAWAIQVSAGHLAQAEFILSGPREDVDRVTASATYHRLVNNRVWAATMAWGRNREAGHTSNAFLAETSADIRPRDQIFARVEVVGKTAADLVLPIATGEPFTVGKVDVGYTRWLAEGHGMRTGLGGSVGWSIVPGALASSYGGRSAREFSVFLAVRAR
ncbi:MAG: hypothetical protein ACRD1V_00925 [Vicinamibacterales bacterium]